MTATAAATVAAATVTPKAPTVHAIVATIAAIAIAALVRGIDAAVGLAAASAEAVTSEAALS